MIFNIQIDKTTPGALLAALLAAWPKYAAYVASFLTIGVMFMNHHGLFERIASLNRALVFINLLPLMAIVFLPFSAAELAANILVPRDANTVALLYALNAFVIAVGFRAVWTYALTYPGLLGRLRLRGSRRLLRVRAAARHHAPAGDALTPTPTAWEMAAATTTAARRS